MSKKSYQVYQSHICSLGRSGTWFPGDLLRLGELGTLRNGCFRREKDLSDVGISFGEEEASYDDVFVRASANRFSAAGAGGAEATGMGQMRLDYSFDREGSFVLSAHRLRHIRIKELSHVCDRVLSAHQSGRWDPQWILIDQVWTADHLVVVISGSSAARGSFSATASAVPTLEDVSDPALDVKFVVESGDLTQFRGSNKTPFFTGRRLKRRWILSDKVEPISTRDKDSETKDLLQLDFMDDLMSSWS